MKSPILKSVAKQCMKKHLGAVYKTAPASRKKTILLSIFLFLISTQFHVFADKTNLGAPIHINNNARTENPFDNIQINELDFLPEFIANLQDREESKEFFINTYMVSEGLNPENIINWNGNHRTCDEGTTSQNFRDEVARRINYFREMAGVPANIALDDELNSNAQKAALMMSANSTLSHTPPSTWDCFTDEGSLGASKSNLGLGSFGWTSIDRYMRDQGDGNSAVGHRRWIIFPKTVLMGAGNIPPTNNFRETNALWVIGDSFSTPRPETRDEFVAWPPPGFVPYQTVYPRWSFSFPDADFSSVTVSMQQNGKTVQISVAPIATGFGENTIVWIPTGMGSNDQWPKPDNDETYTININDVRIDGENQSFTYNVTVFDPMEDNTTTPPPNGKAFTFECERELLKGTIGFEKLNMKLGESGSCELTLIDLNPDSLVEVSSKMRSGIRSCIRVTPEFGMTDSNGKLTVIISAINRGIDWIAWCVPNQDGKFDFSENAYDNGTAWGMIVNVR